MKTIDNSYFQEFCDVIKACMLETDSYEQCLKDMINASEDDANHFWVYQDNNHNMQVVKLDEYSNCFKRLWKAENSINDMQPHAVDAVCVNRDNEWFFIEFKNQKVDNAICDSKKKMLSSLWLIFYIYSRTSRKITSKNDLLRFARENITFILVVSSEKNEDIEEIIGFTWEENGAHYSPSKLKKYKGYYFKDVYILTERGLREFIAKFKD